MNAQLDWLDRRDLGIHRAQVKAHRECGEDWTVRAATFLYHYAACVALGQPFMVEDARQVAHTKRYGVPRNSNPKAWGAAVQMARRKGWIRAAGYAPARSSNGSPKVLWERAS